MAALTPSQLSKLGQVLDARYKLLLDEVRDELEKSENQQYVELIGRMPADVGDESIGHALADLNLAIIDRHIREIRDIDATRARIREGRLGVCIECRDDISFPRLLAYPTAKRCLVCQQQHERTFASENIPKL